MAKTKFFRIAVEGATVDGRTIERNWLAEMAASYNPATYTARINCEHIAGYSPDKPFNAYGSVLALKAEEIDLELNGKTEKRLALFAEIDANDQLVAINKADQKLFTSCEIHPNFAGGGKAYLVGLVVTDSPASLGTEPLKFAAMSRPNVFTPAEETAIEVIAAAKTDDAAAGAFASVKAFFDQLRTGKEVPATTLPETPKPANDNAALTQLVEGMTQMTAAMETAALKTDAEISAIRTEFGALKSQIEGTEQLGNRRPPAAGTQGNFTATDC